MIETKLEAGMYIRTEDGKIGKITKVKNKYCIYADILSLKDWPMSTLRIAKASHNIVNLIEVGDYVNGDRVLEIIEQTDKRLAFTTYTFNEHNYAKIYDIEAIETILTRGQFEREAYKVE